MAPGSGVTPGQRRPAKDTQPADGAGHPVLRVVAGEPTDAELAALVVAVAASSGADAGGEPARSLWRNRGRNIRPAVSPSPGAWRASGLPR